ncbi:unnamed protein product [Peronospora belbahrii]|uniref:Uncharacterized protein n=1 Tax=Peronospora belbahrii TaxID=622444 RepID=A0ABN8CP68_9STRA|nr:unnamed protein product [Peronospora belbahrii]
MAGHGCSDIGNGMMTFPARYPPIFPLDSFPPRRQTASFRAFSLWAYSRTRWFDRRATRRRTCTLRRACSSQDSAFTPRPTLPGEGPLESSVQPAPVA